MTQLRLVWLVTSRELRDQLRDWRILFPIIILTLVFPFLMNATAKVALNFTAEYGTPLIGERLVPFLLMVVGFFPVTVALVVALESFVGEKERGTIEPLLSSPLEDWHLYVGKLLAGTLVPLAASYLGIGVYMTGLVIEGVQLPDFTTMFQTIVLTAVQAVLMVSGAMIISAQSTTVRAANLLASFIVIPVALLVQGESVLMFWGNSLTLWLAILGVAILSALLIRVGLVHFQRENLLSREVDMLNLRWMFQHFWEKFKGRSTSLVEWFVVEVFATVRKLRYSILASVFVGLVGAVAAFIWIQQYHIEPMQITSVTWDALLKNIGQSVIRSPGQARELFLYIFGNNVRVVFVILLLGAVSFSVAGFMAFIANMSLVGGVLGVMQMIGISPWPIFLAGILPHGIIELPAVILASAGVLHMGVMLVTPDARRTFGEVYLEAFADWAKIFIGLVLPMLLVAAAIEAFITPLLLQRVLLSLY